MELGLRLQPHTRAWLKQSTVNSQVSEYCAYLEAHGYATSTQRAYLCCIAHFAYWMRRAQLGLKQLDEDAVARYLADHLPRCNLSRASSSCTRTGLRWCICWRSCGRAALSRSGASSKPC
jgi:hypothetical protein